jgi:dipeptidase E
MRLLLLSNAKREGMGYLEHAQGYLRDFLRDGVKEVLFVPFAAVTKTHDQFVEQVRPVFASLGIRVTGIHAAPDPRQAVRGAQAIVVGGGSTWRLLRELRLAELLPMIRDRVVAGIPYAGWSAGSNIACPTIMTTNDMPICDPGGFDALALVSFQINPHYLHGNPPGFKGETREERITEYGMLQPQVWVAGLREGTGLRIEDGGTQLVGDAPCRIFRHGEAPREFEGGDNLDFLQHATGAQYGSPT